MTAPETPPRRPNRGPAAAAGNRRALIAAAREIFAAEGPSAPFTAIAKRAGVGQGTLYRHFPDRVSLAVAVFEENIAALEALRDDGTIAGLLDRIVEQATASTALIQLLLGPEADARTGELAARFEAVVAVLIERDREAGRIGAHVEAADVGIAVSMIAHELAATPEPDRAAVARRARRLFDAAFAPR
ncbi:TetR family transcriptional regulator [Microbacterium sp. MEC084]|uniref:TetR/AcrR family transcriptional regulator n=1 Tax=Microbacterium sp. MEC084 TaxID=1963027 RepID=UPI00106F3B8D|nr:TetR/AcrR family transcriptional regulator [Microbacterium sp. MEC084]MCD1269628.1 TetR family transcriptional regulator [Microbacterium sp. MEC084]